jgi:predicted dehydrogenase
LEVVVLRVGVIGVAGMGLGHAWAVRALDTSTLAAVSDINDEVLRKTATDFEVPAFTDPKEMYASGAVDAVVIATPAGTHAQLTRDALDAGMHVYLEKPITPTCDEGRALVAYADEKQRVLQVGFQLRFHKGYAAMRDAFEDLGQLRRVHLQATNWFRPQAYFEVSPWRATWRAAGGGVLMNQAVHQVDALIITVGMPSRVEARARTVAHRADVEDEAIAILEWPNGARGTLVASLNDPAGGERFELHCERGSVTLVDGFDVRVTRGDDAQHVIDTATDAFAAPVVEWQPVEVPRSRSEEFDMLCDAHREFAHAIAEKRPTVIDGESGTLSVELANAIYLSTATGAAVDLPLAPGVYGPVFEELASGRRVLGFGWEAERTRPAEGPERK